MNLTDVVIAVLITAAIVKVLCRRHRDRKNGSPGCGCGCPGCRDKNDCGNSEL